MRAFIVLCLVAVACADKLGYNYQPVGHSDSGLSFTPGSSNSGSFIAPGAIGGGSASVVAPAYAPVAELEKEFYTFSAPEGEFNDPHDAERVAGSLKKGIRVVFIKGPENNGLEDAALALAKQAAQQQTAIYVLNKQTDLGELANKLNQLGANNNQKPEVHFVKYRTPEDAANAQRAIQSQYDSLGGSSHSVNGGVAPVLNFASQPAVRTATAQTPQNVYLPSSVFRH
ncbi:uncharacterized protein LOC133330217 [Musca vetustissima]|uniref:uncharacterized protein LOC133330217 n=1 Tax=Musca vetustissima TaxID=27455 RepID=UPI002AB5E96F|nr:uncharacterized protein LOC133330217 [Musca vetustissima]